MSAIVLRSLMRKRRNRRSPSQPEGRRSYIYGKNKYKWSLDPHETRGRRQNHHIHLPSSIHETVIRNFLAPGHFFLQTRCLKAQSAVYE